MCFNHSNSPPSNLTVWAANFISLVVIPLFFVFLRTQYTIHMTDTPPADFGSGSMFDKIAPRYDITNRFLALNLDTSWRRLMVREVVKDTSFIENNDEKGTKEINGRSTVQFLDVATGTADVALLLSNEIQKQTQSQFELQSSNSKIDVNIVGVDPSANMIQIGNDKIESQKKQHQQNVQLRLEIGDARNLASYDDSTFDGATMAFGIRNVPEKETALCEIHRVLKKESKSGSGSKFAILEFSEPDENAGILGAIARFFIRHIVPIIGATLSGAPKEYMHLQNSIQNFPSPPKFVELMEGLKCQGGKENEKKRKGNIGKFRVEALHQLNFGSVQLYVATPIYE